MAPRKEEPAAGESAERRGRPRVWADATARYQEHGRRRGERAALVRDLLDAVRNAAWEDRALQHTINEGDDAAVLTALIAYYRARHWQRVAREHQEEVRREK